MSQFSPGEIARIRPGAVVSTTMSHFKKYEGEDVLLLEFTDTHSLDNRRGWWNVRHADGMLFAVREPFLMKRRPPGEDVPDVIREPLGTWDVIEQEIGWCPPVVEHG